MRKIEQQTIDAIKNGVAFRSGNTEVAREHGVSFVFLHGSLIASCAPVCSWTLAGRNTPTTRSLINALVSEFGGKRVSVRAGGGVCR